MRDANSTPGADIIDITPGLVINGDCDMNVQPDDSMLLVSESVTIRGNGASIVGVNGYLNQAGGLNELNTGGSCPTHSGNYLLIGMTVSLVQVGERNVDNSGIELTIEDLNIRTLSQVASIRDGAKITLRNVIAEDIRDLQDCSRGAVEAFGDADVTLEDVTITGSTDFEDTLPAGVIVGDTGELEIYDSEFARNPTRYAVWWQGKTNIVSSRFFNSGGARNSGTGDMRIVNTLFIPSTLSSGLRHFDGFLVDGGGSMQFQASTVLINVNDCPPLPSIQCDWSGGQPSLATFQAHNGSIDFAETAVHVQTLGAVFSPNKTPLIEALGSGTFSSDDLTYIQSLDWQNTAAIEAILNPPNALVTGPDTLPETTSGLGSLEFSYPDSVTPIITGAAALVDRVSDAGPGGANELKDGRGNTITTDVLGAPRTIGSLRNIGAVQNDLVPGLLAIIPDPTPFTALLFWNQPKSAGITGYDLCQGTGAPPISLPRTTDPCPGNLTEGFSMAPDVTQGSVTNLPPNNSSHWFLVRAVAGANKEPWSNLQEVVVPVTISYPPTVQGPSTQISPIVTGPVTNINYQLQAGVLPAGFSLNPSTGEISGSSQGACNSTTLTILAITDTGALASTVALLTCPTAQPVPVLSGIHLIILSMSLGFMALRFIGRAAKHC